MARLQVGNIHGFPAVAGKNINGGDDLTAGLDIDNLDTISAMRTRLAAISGTTYTSAVLDVMTKNDMEYAIRVNDNASTLK